MHTSLVKQDHGIVGVLNHLCDSLALLERRDTLEVLLGDGLDFGELSLDPRQLLTIDVEVGATVVGVGCGGDRVLRRRLASDTFEGVGVENLDVEDSAFLGVPDSWVVVVLDDGLLDKASGCNSHLRSTTSAEPEHEDDNAVVFDPIVSNKTSILELKWIVDQTLLIRWSTFLVLDQLLQLVHCVQL